MPNEIISNILVQERIAYKISYFLRNNLAAAKLSFLVTITP